MKKVLALFSSAICLLVASSVNAHSCYPSQPQSYSSSQYVNTGSCVGQCNNAYVTQPCSNCQPCTNCQGGMYVGAFAGGNWVHFDHLKTEYSYSYSDHFKPKSDTGFAGAVSLGYKFNNGFRVEGEVGYRRNNWSHHDEQAKWKGHTHMTSVMGNVLYDFDSVSECFPNVVPYVGVGVGYVHGDAHGKFHDFDGNTSIKAKAKSHGIAGQAIAGIGYKLSDSTTLGVEYRYFVAREHARDHSVGISLRQSF